MYDETLAGRLAASFAEDLRHARRIDYDSWRHRGVMTRLTEMIVLPFRELL
jgi:hypothetical protein